MSESAADYIRRVSDSMDGGYPDTCVVHARRIAELLLGEGKMPWIGRVREVIANYRGPLIPRRFLGRGVIAAWTTHYIACSGRDAYDPLLGTPNDIDTYGVEAFGRPLTVERHFDAAATEELLRKGTFLETFRPR